MSAGVLSNPVVLTAVTPNAGPNSVTAVLVGNAGHSRQGGTSASASSGGGGWQVTDRTRTKAATEWLDYYPLVMKLSLRIDGGIGTDDEVAEIESVCSILESFEMPIPGSVPPLPPLVTIDGPVPHTDLFWVCSGLDFPAGDDSAMRNSAGLRTMQMATVELTEFSPSTAIAEDLTPAQAAALASVMPTQTIPGGPASGQTTLTASGQTYTVVAGDTLQSVAAKVLGSTADWPSIALLNGLPMGAILVPGELIQLPAA